MATLAVTGRADLSDAQWAVLEPLLPRGKKPGRPPEWTKRQLIDGIRWRTRAGAPWRDVPPGYGRWQTVYGLFRRWQRNGTWRKILTALQGRADAAGLITWDVSVDSTVARAHQHAAGARKNGNLQAEPPGGIDAEPADHGQGRSRGGLTTKVHLACEQGQKPLSVVITAGQRGDSPQFQAVLGRIRVPRARRGRPRTRPDRVLADKAYGSRVNRSYLRRRGIQCTIPEKADQVRHRKARAAEVAARPPSTPKTTKPAMPWNVVSPGSSATAPWPPATTSWPSATKPPSASPPSTNGSYPTYETRPSTSSARAVPTVARSSRPSPCSRADGCGGEDRRRCRPVPDQWQATLRLAEYQAGADETDADQRTLQRGGRPVHREYADD